MFHKNATSFPFGQWLSAAERSGLTLSLLQFNYVWLAGTGIAERVKCFLRQPIARYAERKIRQSIRNRHIDERAVRCAIPQNYPPLPVTEMSC